MDGCSANPYEIYLAIRILYTGQMIHHAMETVKIDGHKQWDFKW